MPDLTSLVTAIALVHEFSSERLRAARVVSESQRSPVRVAREEPRTVCSAAPRPSVVRAGRARL